MVVLTYTVSKAPWIVSLILGARKPRIRTQGEVMNKYEWILVIGMLSGYAFIALLVGAASQSWPTIILGLVLASSALGTSLAYVLKLRKTNDKTK